MKEQIGCFAHQSLILLRHRCQRDFHSFLADFLRDARRAFGPNSGGITSFGFFRDTLRNHTLEFCKKGELLRLRGNCIAKAALSSLMTGWAMWVSHDEQSVVVAVGNDTHELECVSGGFAFGPKSPLAATEKSNVAGFDRDL